MNNISLNEFEDLLRGKPGLILGIDQIAYPGKVSEIEQMIAQKFTRMRVPLHKSADPQPEDATSTRDAIRTEIESDGKSWLPHLSLGALAKVQWSGVLSLSPDLSFEQMMQDEADRKPSRRAVYIGYGLREPPPPRSVACYKMLGAFATSDFVITNSAFLTRRTHWRFAVPRFADSVAGNPVVCVGLSAQLGVFLELLAEFTASPSIAPSRLVFLSDDPCCNSDELKEIVAGRTRLSIVQATAGELSRAVARAAKKNFAAKLDFPTEQQKQFESLIQFQDVATLVNLQVEPALGSHEVTALKEILFSPSIPRWDSFAHKLDFRRTVTATLDAHIKSVLQRSDADTSAILLLGSAACGKTTVLKRQAYDLAQSGVIVLWQNASFYSDRDTRLKACLTEVQKLVKEKNVRVCYFMDDPLTNGHSVPNAVLQHASRLGLSLVVVVGMRSSDWATIGREGFVDGAGFCEQVELEDDLDDAETKALPEYLVTLGIENSKEIAKGRCAVASAKTSDSLSLLYWLLPETRKNIADSIRDEFHRLGDRGGFRRMIMGEANSSPTILRDAYSMVAVATNYGVPLPVELLVAALEVDFGNWDHAAKASGRAWGILYSEPSEDNSERYRTRNKIVTDLLLEAINGGSQSIAGELRILRQLISACNGRDGTMYRQFLIQLLVPWQKLKDRLSYLDGLALYDLAIDSLSLRDQTLMHHKGLWMKNVGRVPVEAATVLSLALVTAPYPYSEKNEADEHIHTSIAAAKLDAVDSGELDWTSGKKDALHHLEQARSSAFFNPSAAHVSARLSARIIKRSAEHEIVDSFEIAAKTLNDLERTKQVVTTPVGRMRNTRRSIEYLDSAASSVLNALVAPDQLEDSADEIWKSFNSQAGFVCVAHRMFTAAMEQNTDRLFRKADDFCLRARRLIEDARQLPSASLAEVHLQIVYQGSVVRRFMTPGNNAIDWERICSLATESCGGRTAEQYPFSHFLLAVAKAHLGDWIAAESEFSSLRGCMRGELLYEPRAILLGPKGGPRTLQGKIREIGGGKFITVEEIGRDVRCDARTRWPRNEETAHAQIRFAFYGPLAFDRNA